MPTNREREFPRMVNDPWTKIRLASPQIASVPDEQFLETTE